MAKLITHYENLQVTENASAEVIQGAYRYLAQKWHPDKNPDKRELAERNTKIINDAYRVLSDPELRRQHDNWIREQRDTKEQVAQDHGPSSTAQPARQTAALANTPDLWNPNAAASWSLLFSPLFGAWLHASNWTALGENDRARKSMRWVYFCTLFLLVAPFLPDKAATGAGFWILIIWYFSSGRAQAKYIRQRLQQDYHRKGWAKPLGIALLVVFAYIGLATVLALLFEPQAQ